MHGLGLLEEIKVVFIVIGSLMTKRCALWEAKAKAVGERVLLAVLKSMTVLLRPADDCGKLSPSCTKTAQ